jgi:hypothetical protein
MDSRHLHIGSGTLGVSTDELFTGSAVTNGENGGNKVEHFQSVGFVLVEKVHAVGDLYNVGAMSVCIVLQDELQSSKNKRKKEEQCKSNTGVASRGRQHLLKKEKCSLVVSSLPHLQKRLPSLLRRNVTAAFALHRLNLEIDNKTLLNDGILEHFLKYA